MKDITKIGKSHDGSGSLINHVNKTMKKAKKQISGFLRMLLGTLTASLLGNILVGKLKIPG